MLYLFSGFSADFLESIQPFTESTNGKIKSVALLLQGGIGYEAYLKNYIDPLNYYGITDISIIVPENGESTISKDQLIKISEAEAVFIGGGDTAKYIELYCTKEIRELLKYKFQSGNNIAGLSAGSIIMADKVALNGKRHSGLEILHNFSFFPHFEEDNYGHQFLSHLSEYPQITIYGLETRTFLEIDVLGNIRKKGNGKVFKGVSNSINGLNIEVIE